MVPDSPQDRQGDPVNHGFHAHTPNRLRVVDYTHIASWAAAVCTAQVMVVAARRVRASR